MIIGDGLIARSFDTSSRFHNYVIFASGVSFSGETSKTNFDKEVNLLDCLLATYPNKKLIYFSTCSVASKKITPYILHKLNTESYIRSHARDFLILRLPNVVGNSNNNNLLVNHFYNSLMNDYDVTINTDCLRHLLDVKDIPFLVDVLSKHYNNTAINVAFNNAINLETLLTYLEIIANKKFKKINKVQSGIDYIIDNSEFVSYISKYNFFTTNPLTVLQKYYHEN
jgi:nucleoside-diphosphate-sugar epimerase